jgi:putative transposase
MRYYRRRLPHRDAPGVLTFVTWSLYGGLPRERFFAPTQIASGEVFAAWDRLLDECRYGARYLSEPPIARMVLEKIVTANADVDAFVVMPNHVHVLWAPRISLPELMRLVKGATAFEANRILGRRGQRFWQEEYFDRQARSRVEAERIRQYIEWNPVKAGLASTPESYPWSSAHLRTRGGRS